MKTSPTISRTLLLLSLFLLSSAAALAEEAVIRILFFTGNVTVTTKGGSQPAKIGQVLSGKDVVVLAKGATVQLSVNGKVVKYTKPMKLKLADAVKRAGKGENAAVANSVRTLAAASGAAREQRTTRAGATRARDTANLLANAQQNGTDAVTREANSELGRRTGIDDPLGKARGVYDMLDGEPMVVLEPRSTAVPRGPVQFRWMRTPGVPRYVVTVRNHLGAEVFRVETADTGVLWTAPVLEPDAVYRWTLENATNPLNRSTVSFHQLNASADEALRTGEAEIRKEFSPGDEPALMLVLAAFYADHECFGQAARLYGECASKSPQHWEELMDLAREQYVYNMFVPEEEVQRVCGRP